MAIRVHAIVTKIQRHVSIFAIINPNFIALEKQAIFFTCEIFAPKTLFSTHEEMGVVVFFEVIVV